MEIYERLEGVYMHLTQHVEIDNSAEYATKTRRWRNLGAKLYRKIMNKVEWQELLVETYLVTPGS